MPRVPFKSDSRDGDLPSYLSNYPQTLPRRLNLTLLPLDITSQHRLSAHTFQSAMEPLKAKGSPLATWVDAFITSTFRKVASLSTGPMELELHDPLCVWYCMRRAETPGWKVIRDEDLRVETTGQWTRGMCVVDRRDRQRGDADAGEEVIGDAGSWLSSKAGNRLSRCVSTPGGEIFVQDILKRVFAPA